MKTVVILLALGLVGCATLPPECKTESVYRPMHCPPPPRREPTPKECTELGGVQIWRDGYYRGCASSDSVWRTVRGYPGR
jgi:hypothetical protein